MQETYDREEYALRQKEKRARIGRMISDETKLVVGDENRFREYLDMQARFDRFSVLNVLLIMAQKRDVNVIKTFEQWKAEKVYVNKGEKGLVLLLPKAVQKPDGTRFTCWNMVTFFDSTQTSAKDDAYAFEHLEYDSGELGKVIINAFDVPFETYVKMPDERAAVFDSDREVIMIRSGLREEDFFEVFREIALYEMSVKCIDQGIPFVREELIEEANVISYMLCRKFSVRCDEIIRVPASFRLEDEIDVRKKLSENKRTVNDISRSISRLQKNMRVLEDYEL